MVTKFMGLVLFLVGFFLIALATAALLNIVPGIGLERILLFIGGLILCIIGYVMARDQAPMD
ncbi:MAG: hypothetical protein KGJ80_15290 [Chloroflexota bacterium]|nr:hypothetical protein [Chloroflexota bacterium]